MSAEYFANAPGRWQSRGVIYRLTKQAWTLSEMAGRGGQGSKNPYLIGSHG
jgi:hypothetical protein